MTASGYYDAGFVYLFLQWHSRKQLIVKPLAVRFVRLTRDPNDDGYHAQIHMEIMIAEHILTEDFRGRTSASRMMCVKNLGNPTIVTEAYSSLSNYHCALFVGSDISFSPPLVAHSRRHRSRSSPRKHYRHMLTAAAKATKASISSGKAARTMRFSRGAAASTRTSCSGISGSLAMVVATAQFVPSSHLSRHLMVAAFSSSFHIQQVRASSTQSSSSSSSSRMMGSTSIKKDQSFVTWSFDEPCKTMAWTPLSSAALTAGTKSDNWDDDADLVFVGVLAPKKDNDKDDDEEEQDNDEELSVTLTDGAKDLDEKLGGALSDLMLENAKAFKNGAKAGSMTPVLRVFVDGKAKRYVGVGLGCVPDADKGFEGVGSALGKALASSCDSEKKVKRANFLIPESVMSDSVCARDIATAFYSSLYSDNRFRTGKKVKTPAEDLESLTILSDGSTGVDGVQDALDAGKKLATGISMTKDIVNAPHNVLNSESLADTARRLAEESGGSLTCTILGKKECEERGMGAYLGVARASETDPQFIHVTYTPSDGAIVKKIGVIGKGLLFDTGGYNIKTGMMELMKFDCGGAAAVLGAARAIGALKPPGVECHFVVAACENMINAKGVVPSDILTASNGKTIEVLNTDAEGRLTLADALVYCDKEIGCESIIELSTLTGACMVALGKVRASII